MADSRIDELRRRLERDPGSRLFAQLAEEHRKAGNHADAIRVAPDDQTTRWLNNKLTHRSFVERDGVRLTPTACR